MAKAKKDLVEVVTKEVSPIVKEATELVIETQAQMPAAVSLLSRLNTLNDKVVEDREKITKPMNAALKEVRAKYKPVESALEEAIGLIRDKMSAFQTEQVRIKKAKEAEEAAKVASGEVSLEEGVAALEGTSSEVASVETKEGDVSFKTVEKLKIVNTEQLIKDIIENHAGSFERFVSYNEKELLIALKAGTVIKGVTIEEIQVPINYRA